MSLKNERIKFMKPQPRNTFELYTLKAYIYCLYTSNTRKVICSSQKERFKKTMTRGVIVIAPTPGNYQAINTSAPLHTLYEETNGAECKEGIYKRVQQDTSSLEWRYFAELQVKRNTIEYENTHYKSRILVVKDGEDENSGINTSP